MYHKFECFEFLNTDKIQGTPLRLCDFGIESRFEETYDYNNENRENFNGYLFQYTLSGAGIFESNQNYVLSEEKAFFVKLPHHSRYYLPKDALKDWKFFYLHFTGTMADDFYQHIINQVGNVFSLNKNSDTVRLFFDEHSGIKGGKQYRSYESGVFLYQFLTSLLRDIERVGNGAPNAYVDTAIQWMHRNYSSQDGLERMCQEISISLAHLDRQFHQMQGMSPLKFLTNIRIEHAMALLLNTNLSINEIALECGFANGNYFTKVFKRILHTKPSEYRNKYLH